MEATRKLRCSFCGKGQDDCQLISGPDRVCICDACVDVSRDILDELRNKPGAVGAARAVLLSSDRAGEIWDAVIDAARISELAPEALATSLIDARRALDAACGTAAGSSVVEQNGDVVITHASGSSIRLKQSGEAVLVTNTVSVHAPEVKL